jgi:hypothetical protein
VSAPTIAGRPVQPSIRREVGEYLMAADPRCHHEPALVMSGVTCPRCLHSLSDYVAVAPIEWPS